MRSVMRTTASQKLLVLRSISRPCVGLGVEFKQTRSFDIRYAYTKDRYTVRGIQTAVLCYNYGKGTTGHICMPLGSFPLYRAIISAVGPFISSPEVVRPQRNAGLGYAQVEAVYDYSDTF